MEDLHLAAAGRAPIASQSQDKRRQSSWRERYTSVLVLRRRETYWNTEMV